MRLVCFTRSRRSGRRMRQNKSEATEIDEAGKRASTAFGAAATRGDGACCRRAFAKQTYVLNISSRRPVENHRAWVMERIGAFQKCRTDQQSHEDLVP